MGSVPFFDCGLLQSHVFPKEFPDAVFLSLRSQDGTAKPRRLSPYLTVIDGTSSYDWQWNQMVPEDDGLISSFSGGWYEFEDCGWKTPKNHGVTNNHHQLGLLLIDPEKNAEIEYWFEPLIRYPKSDEYWSDDEGWNEARRKYEKSQRKKRIVHIPLQIPLQSPRPRRRLLNCEWYFSLREEGSRLEIRTRLQYFCGD